MEVFYIKTEDVSFREENDRGCYASGDGEGTLTFTDARIPHTTGPY